MNKYKLQTLLIPFFVLVLAFNPSVMAKSFEKNEKMAISISNTQKVEEIAEVKEFLKLHDSYSNACDIEKLKSLYSAEYQNGDGLKTDDFFEMIQKTWQTYPNMKYYSEVNEIRVDEDYATVTTIDYASATTAKVSDITNDKGDLLSKSMNILYLKRFGKHWKIFSDRVLYEKTFLRYGDTRDIVIDFKAPEQIAAGQDYTAKLDVIVPKNTLALGSISRELIVYPDVEPKDVFRQISTGYGTLERVMKSNTSGNNEFAVASIGFTTPRITPGSRIRLNLKGIVFVMQRVNVLAKSTYVAPEVKSNEI